MTRSRTTAKRVSSAAELRALPGNAVVYSDAAWAVARKSNPTGPDRFFVDPGAHAEGRLDSEAMWAWTTDWVQLR